MFYREMSLQQEEDWFDGPEDEYMGQAWLAQDTEAGMVRLSSKPLVPAIVIARGGWCSSERFFEDHCSTHVRCPKAYVAQILVAGV